MVVIDNRPEKVIFNRWSYVTLFAMRGRLEKKWPGGVDVKNVPNGPCTKEFHDIASSWPTEICSLNWLKAERKEVVDKTEKRQ